MICGREAGALDLLYIYLFVLGGEAMSNFFLGARVHYVSVVWVAQQINGTLLLCECHLMPAMGPWVGENVMLDRAG